MIKLIAELAGSLYWWWESRAAVSSTSQRLSPRFRSGLSGVSANPWVKMMSHAPWTTLSQLEHDESWQCLLRICPCRKGRKKSIDGKTCSFSWFRLSADIMFWEDNVAEPRPDQLNLQPDHNTATTSSTSLLTLMHPSLWNRVNQTHQTTWPFSITPESNLYAA